MVRRLAQSRMWRTSLINLPLYLGFANNENGRTLRALFDRRMEVLVKSGELKPIFERWQEPYPFEGSAKPAVE